MGAAAEHRGNALICRHIDDELAQRRYSEQCAFALQVAEDCNVFSTQAISYLADPKGLRQKTIESAKARRGWAKRHEKLMAAHCVWVDVDYQNIYAYHAACVARAKAARELLVFALGCWTIPDDIRVPRAAA